MLLRERLSDDHHRFSVRPIANPNEALSTATHRPGRWHFEGDHRLWDRVPRFSTVWMNDDVRNGLIHIHPDDPDVDPLAWFNKDSYDLMWQGLGEPYEVPGTDLLIITVQRDSRPVIYEPATRRVLGHLKLGDRQGNPRLYFRVHADELWVDDYDTLLRLRPHSSEVLDALRLQGGHRSGRAFIGDFWFPPDERVCVVPRPFSGDVALLDPERFEIVEVVKMRKQPLDAVLLSDGTVLARDWRSASYFTLTRTRPSAE